MHFLCWMNCCFIVKNLHSLRSKNDENDLLASIELFFTFSYASRMGSIAIALYIRLSNESERGINN